MLECPPKRVKLTSHISHLTSHFPQPTSHSQLPTSYFPLLTSHFPPPTACQEGPTRDVRSSSPRKQPEFPAGGAPVEPQGVPPAHGPRIRRRRSRCARPGRAAGTRTAQNARRARRRGGRQQVGQTEADPRAGAEGRGGRCGDPAGGCPLRGLGPALRPPVLCGARPARARQNGLPLLRRASRRPHRMGTLRATAPPGPRERARSPA